LALSWSLRFAEPIVLADGAKLATLRENVSEYFSGSLVFLPNGAAVLGHDLHGNADLRSRANRWKLLWQILPFGHFAAIAYANTFGA